MTINELSQLYYLKNEIEMDRERLEALRLQYFDILEQNIKETSIDEALLKSNCKDKFYINDFIELQNTILNKLQRCIAEQKQLEEYINAIPDDLLRKIFTLRFAKCMNWQQVALMVGGGNTEGNIRQMCHRYVNKTAVGCKQ